MTTQRVLANLCWMVPGDVGGSEEYTTRLLSAVAQPQAGSDVEVTVAAMAGVAGAHPHLDSLRWRQCVVPGRLRAVRVLTESTWLAREAQRHDLVHHFGGRVPAIRGGPAVVTIHDIQPLDHPENFSAVKRAYLARALPRSVTVARLVVTPSAWVAERVVERLPVSEGRVRVVPSTYSLSSPNFSADGSVRPISREIWGGRGGPLIVYPAMTHPHKDHATLVAAFARVRERHPDARLLLIGGRGRSHEEVERLVGTTPGAMYHGRVASSVVGTVIQQADVLAFPSRYEGFGLPVLEAMRVGTPVVVADATALPEVVGGGGVLVSPGDVASWADALLDVVENGVDGAMAEAATQRVEHYSPARAGERLLDAWHTALDR